MAPPSSRPNQPSSLYPHSHQVLQFYLSLDPHLALHHLLPGQHHSLLLGTMPCSSPFYYPHCRQNNFKAKLILLCLRLNPFGSYPLTLQSQKSFTLPPATSPLLLSSNMPSVTLASFTSSKTVSSPLHLHYSFASAEKTLPAPDLSASPPPTHPSGIV